VLVRTAVSVLAFAVLWTAAVRADAPMLDGDDIEALFSIRKSQNRNRVDYGLRIGPDCAPTGDEPVVPYWRMLEDGPRVTERLAPRERRAYGLAAQTIEQTSNSASIRLRLRALGGRQLRVVVRRDPSGCTAHATVPIAGVPSVITDIFVVLRTAVSIDHVELRGRSLRDGTPTFERLEP
jgi:hypothetical protein